MLERYRIVRREEKVSVVEERPTLGRAGGYTLLNRIIERARQMLPCFKLAWLSSIFQFIIMSAIA